MGKKSNHKHVYDYVELKEKAWFTHEKVCRICGHVNNLVRLETFEDYINQMIKDGYWSEKDLAPLKCHHCGSKNLDDRNHCYENLGCVSYQRFCNDCGEFVSEWSYGHWEI